MAKGRRSLQSDGLRSRVYVPIIRTIFERRYKPGQKFIEFTLDDVRDVALELGVVVRNPGDVIYRMRSRTKLPEEILALGFYVLRTVGRGRYRLEQAESTVVAPPKKRITEALDQTPLPVRRLLPETLAEVDEQGLLTIVSYSKLLDHFTGLQVFRLRSHVRKSVAKVGQAEIDEVDVGVALRDDEVPVIFPIEAKAADEAVNRVQITMGVLYVEEFFPGHEIRPVAIKLDYESLVHIMEFNATVVPSDLKIVNAETYRLNLSERQRALIRSTRPVQQ